MSDNSTTDNSSSAIYLKVGESCYYRIANEEILAVSIERRSIRSLKSLPTAYVGNYKIITKKDFEGARQALNI